MAPPGRPWTRIPESLTEKSISAGLPRRKAVSLGVDGLRYVVALRAPDLHRCTTPLLNKPTGEQMASRSQPGPASFTIEQDW